MLRSRSRIFDPTIRFPFLDIKLCTQSLRPPPSGWGCGVTLCLEISKEWLTPLSKRVWTLWPYYSYDTYYSPPMGGGLESTTPPPNLSVAPLVIIYDTPLTSFNNPQLLIPILKIAYWSQMVLHTQTTWCMSVGRTGNLPHLSYMRIWRCDEEPSSYCHQEIPSLEHSLLNLLDPHYNVRAC